MSSGAKGQSDRWTGYNKTRENDVYKHSKSVLMSFLILPPFPGQIFKNKFSCIIVYGYKVFLIQHFFSKGHAVELVPSSCIK